MNREEFKQKLGLVSDQLDKSRLKKVINQSIESKKDYGNQRGDYQLGITREELSELSIELSKVTRGRASASRLGILEEMADVELSMYYLRNIFGISGSELNQAINVKLDRLEALVKHNLVH